MIMCFFNAYIQIKILIISGSPRPRGNTKIALDEMVKIFDQEDIESEIEHVGNKDIRGCIACISCKARLGHCVFDDCINAIDDQKFEEADGLVDGTPDYYGSVNATLVAFLTRLFYSTPFDKTMKVGASAVVARRGGISSTYDEINKFFCYFRNANCFFTILEFYSWKRNGRSKSR